jgi:hypothetical protein
MGTPGGLHPCRLYRSPPRVDQTGAITRTETLTFTILFFYLLDPTTRLVRPPTKKRRLVELLASPLCQVCRLCRPKTNFLEILNNSQNFSKILDTADTRRKELSLQRNSVSVND